MADAKKIIAIESILGGLSPTTHFAAKDQFRASLGIDPAQPIDDSDTAYSSIASGLLRPAASEKFSGTTITSAPLWMIPNPKDAVVYVLDANGSLYSVDAAFATVSALSDAGTLSNGRGNGAEYYDNYIYISKNTTIARVGPLNGTTTWNGDYWVTTLSKTALSDTTYPTTLTNKIQLPNHVLKRHSDGKLYIADTVGNQGTLHYIQTSKTTVEGDTDAGSTYSAVTVGYGLWPTAMESYGEELAIAFYEGSVANYRQARAKLAFWDTTTTNVSKMIWVEYPDQIITATKNVNGVLYVASGNINAQGFRITRFMGGYSFQEFYYSETGEPPLPGAMEALLNRLLFGTNTNVPETDGCVYSTGLQKGVLGDGVFNIMRATGSNSSTTVTAVCVADNPGMGFLTPIIGWTQAGDGSTGVSHGLDKQGTAYNNAPAVWWSQMYRIGQSFKITKIRIPFAKPIGVNSTAESVSVAVYVDDSHREPTSGEGTKFSMTTINETNYPNAKFVVFKADSSSNPILGKNNFWLEIKWTGADLTVVELPIIIEYELIDD